MCFEIDRCIIPFISNRSADGGKPVALPSLTSTSPLRRSMAMVQYQPSPKGVRSNFYVSSERFLEDLTTSSLQRRLSVPNFPGNDVPLRQPSYHLDASFWLGGAAGRTPTNGYYSSCCAPRPIHRTTSSRRDISSPATLLHPLCGRPNFRDAVI